MIQYFLQGDTSFVTIQTMKSNIRHMVGNDIKFVSHFNGFTHCLVPSRFEAHGSS